MSDQGYAGHSQMSAKKTNTLSPKDPLHPIHTHICVKGLSMLFSWQDTHITPSYTDYKQEYEFSSSH